MMMAFFTTGLLALLASAQAVYTPEALLDQVVDLPGAELLDIPFNHFSGYLTIPGTSGALTKNMHYWLVESSQSPSADPLAFWTNGGPGCSGLLGMLTEQGPFRPNADMSLSLNKYAWNTISNMVFIESPAGVGFSYSDNKADYTTGDAQTALDNYNLIQAFLVKFPQFKTNDLYISSESYGGHYMPTLAKQIVDSNAAGNNPVLNFKGFAVGNPYTDVYSGTPAMLDTYWGHQLIPKPTWDAYQADCKNAAKPNVLECTKLQIQMNGDVGNLNPYALDYPVCTTDSLSKKGRAQRIWMQNHMLESQLGSKEAVRQLKGVTLKDDYEPCEDNYEDTYLNLASVKAALHVKSNIRWESCSNTVNYNMSDSQVSTAPIYNYLIDGKFGLNILVYSGDDDGVCATIGTQEWIWGLGYTVAANMWSSYMVSGQTAGYQTQWANTKLGFLTIHGAGHEVPTYKPEVALDMWSRYLAGEFTSATK
jgi:carboxypeptidase C (cathepsin A)